MIPQRPPALPARKKPIRSLLVWLAVGGGSGLSPRAPGTCGSLLGIPLVWGLQRADIETLLLIPVVTVLFLIGVPICAAGARHFEMKDPPWVVFDEIAVFPLVFVLQPMNWLSGLLGFALFRLFDISKPWPIRQFEHLPGGWGIMADDLIAACYAMIILKCCLMIWGN